MTLVPGPEPIGPKIRPWPKPNSSTNYCFMKIGQQLLNNLVHRQIDRQTDKPSNKRENDTSFVEGNTL